MKILDIIAQTIVGIIKSESIIKNIFSGIGYLLFISGIGNILVKAFPKLTLFSFTFVGIPMILLYGLSMSFWVLHVLRPIIKITVTDFGIPGIDEDFSTERFKGKRALITVLLFGVFVWLSSVVGFKFFEIVMQQLGA